MSPPHIPEMGILAIIGQLPTLLLKPSVPVVLMCLGPLSCLYRSTESPIYTATISENPPFCQYGRPDSTGPSLQGGLGPVESGPSAFEQEMLPDDPRHRRGCGVNNCWQFSVKQLIMDVVSRRISLAAWGRLYGFDQATTSRLHHAGKLPPELQIEQLPNGRYYVLVPPENDGRCVVYARVSSGDQKEDLERQVGRVVEWATQQGYQPHEVVKEVGSGLNGNRRRLRRLVADHTVGTIVVEHRERLSRFGFEYVEAALAGRGARILVMDEGELEDDLVRDVPW